MNTNLEKSLKAQFFLMIFWYKILYCTELRSIGFSLNDIYRTKNKKICLTLV